jgi:hypothetical protein
MSPDEVFATAVAIAAGVWLSGMARLEAAGWQGPLDLVVRPFPAEWIKALPRATEWTYLLQDRALL